MSMSDARQFAELSARVDTLEGLCRSLAASVDALEDRVYGKDVHSEVLGLQADEAARIEDRAARHGLRTLLERGGVTVAEDSKAFSGAAVAPAPAEANDLATDPGLKDKLAALQGGEVQKPEPSKPGMRK